CSGSGNKSRACRRHRRQKVRANRNAPHKEGEMARRAPHKPERSAAPRPVRVLVDLNRCQGYAQCCFLAPGTFRLHGQEALWYDPAPDEAQRERVLSAAAACPVQAILVECSAVGTRQKSGVPRG